MDPPESFDMLVNVALVCVFVDAVEMLAPIAAIPTARPVALGLLLSSVFALNFSGPIVLMMPPPPLGFPVDESPADASVPWTPMPAPPRPRGAEDGVGLGEALESAAAVTRPDEVVELPTERACKVVVPEPPISALASDTPTPAPSAAATPDAVAFR